MQRRTTRSTQEFELVFDELGKCTVGMCLAAPADYVGQTLPIR